MTAQCEVGYLCRRAKTLAVLRNTPTDRSVVALSKPALT